MSLNPKARIRRTLATLAGLLLAGSLSLNVSAGESYALRYLVVFGGSYALDGSYALGGNYALNHEYALGLVESAGGTVTNDLSKQIGVMVVESSNDAFYALMSSYALVEVVDASDSHLREHRATVQVVLDESTEIVRAERGVLILRREGLMAPAPFTLRRPVAKTSIVLPSLETLIMVPWCADLGSGPHGAPLP